MLIDMVEQYDQKKKTYLKEYRTQIILFLSTKHDHKKLMTFLGKAWVINIDDENKKVYLGFSNDFILAQAKKFFNKSFKEAIHEVYNSQFDVEYCIYPPLSEGSDLTVDLKKILNIEETTTKEKDTSKGEIGKEIKSEFSNYFWILLDPSYRFDNFIAGANNQFAFSAAKAVVENPWWAYNPLFLYGNVGLGKTHLMQAIGNEIVANDPKKTVIYLPTTKLIDEIVQALKTGKLNNLNRKFDDIDVLLIDDIQFLANKEKTEEIFHNLFNDFQMKKKQIVISSDRPPKELLYIEPRLKSRFSLGLVADIQAPDFETRIAILQAKLDSKGEDIDFELLSIVAQYVKSNVRELEGILNSLISRKKFSGTELTENDIYGVLRTLGYSTTPQVSEIQVGKENTKSEQSFDTVVELVANYYGIAVEEIKSDSRKKEITTARQILMLLAKKYFKWTLERIGEYFGKNHATAIYAIGNIEKKLKTDENIQHDYNVFIERVE